ncbi:hypothetical protein DFH09DRAFT_1508747 [Mycena vulgaris]|nr:hypothetical protein DFH09DRAFT_1508747 [Mycena vulgaris]
MPASISSQSPPPAPVPRRRASASPARDVGVKGITRKVIRTLEGLGHLDPALEAEADAEEDDDEHEVARSRGRCRSSSGGRGEAARSGGDEEDRLGDPEEGVPLVYRAGFITLGLYLTPSMSPRTVVLVLWSALAVIAPTDFVRLRNPAVERVYERALGFLMRESERHGTNGTLWYILGVNFALTFYPIDVATVAILMCVLLLFSSFPAPPFPHFLLRPPLRFRDTSPFSSPSPCVRSSAASPLRPLSFHPRPPLSMSRPAAPVCLPLPDAPRTFSDVAPHLLAMPLTSSSAPGVRYRALRVACPLTLPLLPRSGSCALL